MIPVYYVQICLLSLYIRFIALTLTTNTIDQSVGRHVGQEIDRESADI